MKSFGLTVLICILKKKMAQVLQKATLFYFRLIPFACLGLGLCFSSCNGVLICFVHDSKIVHDLRKLFVCSFMFKTEISSLLFNISIVDEDKFKKFG